MKWSPPPYQLHRTLNRAYRSPGLVCKHHCASHHRGHPLRRLAASTGYHGHRRPPYLRAWVERSHPQLRLLPSHPLALPRRSATPGATSFFTAERLHTDGSLRPSFGPSPPPGGPQPLRGPHRPPRRLFRPMAYLYRCRSPPPIAPPRTGSPVSTPLPRCPEMGPPTSLGCFSLRLQTTPPSWVAGNRPAPLPVAMELPPLPLFDRGPPAHVWPASLVGPDGLGPE
jgi:hypothetical protein